MTDTDEKRQSPETRRRVTYTRTGGGLCEVELHMPVSDDSGAGERRLRMNRAEIRRYYSDLDPARSIIETAKGEQIAVMLPFKSLCKRLDGGQLAGKRVIDLSDVTGHHAEEHAFQNTLKRLFNTEAALDKIKPGDTLVIAYGYSSKGGDKLYKLFAFLKSEVTDISSDNNGTFARLRDWGDYKDSWGMTTNYGPYVARLSPSRLAEHLKNAVDGGVKITDLRGQTLPPAKARVTAGLKLSGKAAKICRNP